jgi:hypothetical protein
MQKYYATQIPPSIYPTTEGDGFADVFVGEVAAVLGTHIFQTEGL